VILCERTLAPSSPTIVQKEIERVGVIDWWIELNICSVELVETNLHGRNPAQRLHAIRDNAGAMDGVGMAVEGGGSGPSGRESGGLYRDRALEGGM